MDVDGGGPDVEEIVINDAPRRELLEVIDVDLEPVLEDDVDIDLVEEEELERRINNLVAEEDDDNDEFLQLDDEDEE